MTVSDSGSEGFGVLPDELILAVFQFLPLETLLTCENVCKHWRKLAQDTALWRRFVIVYSGKPGQSEVSEKNLEIINSHGQLIHQLKLQYLYSYQEIKSILEQCSNLTSIELVMCRLGKEFESYINRWPNLKKINLKNSLFLTNDVVINYAHFQQLNFLALSDFGLSPVNCNTLLHCPYLNHILIEKIKNLSSDFIKELIICKQKILTTFHIYGGVSIDDHSLQLLSQCSMLRDLAIIRCENLTDKGLISLVNLQKIQHLQIWNNTNFSEFVLLHTLSSPNLKTLESLSLSRIGNISPIIVDVISEYYKNLKFLALYQCPRIINTDYEKQLKSKFRNIDVVLY
ncbi:S-phase kinase-associated protein 2-like [Papilio machaon]|uniref:S-phase kinase-associated protein 2-like n=1 Tax=Papilio machaon TaxID=76193 RepID=UPI001E6652AB|nr:S-phase kinase-associated protein 2-like [Papilio machaon]XP_014368416.2 S-phase kinase-associated protein 2-like [Papilio machaon]